MVCTCFVPQQGHSICLTSLLAFTNLGYRPSSLTADHCIIVGRQWCHFGAARCVISKGDHTDSITRRRKAREDKIAGLYQNVSEAN
jgi:hypothetical protein